MEINNPQSFDHIIGLNGEILAPKVLLDTEIEPAKIQAEPIIWRKTTADEFHVPAAVLGANGEILQPKVLAIGDIEIAKVQSAPIIWRKRTADEYHFPGGILSDTGTRLQVSNMLYGDVDPAKISGNVTLLYNAIADSYLLPPGIVEAGLGMMRCKVIEIGVWNMEASDTGTTAHGITDFRDIRTVFTIIRRDDDVIARPLTSPYGSSGDNEGGVYEINATDIIMKRRTSGFFDNVNYNDGVMNRGFITIWYQD